MLRKYVIVLSFILLILQSMCGEQDLKDLGLPMGPRKKLLLLLQEHKDGKVSNGVFYVKLIVWLIFDNETPC